MDKKVNDQEYDNWIIEDEEITGYIGELKDHKVWDDIPLHIRKFLNKLYDNAAQRFIKDLMKEKKNEE